MIAIWFLLVSGLLLYVLLKPASVKTSEDRKASASAWKPGLRIPAEPQLYSTRFLSSNDMEVRYD